MPLSLVRVDSAGTLMDSLVYRYQTNRNRLTHVDDPGGVAGNHSFDVDDQDTNTYTYDASGNMIGDTASGITAIVWTPSNKIQSITKGSTSKLEYTYDAMGNRVVKRYYQPASTLKSTTWYARDAQGNILSVYERPHADKAIKQSEVHIYGSSRLGIEQRGITYSTSNYAWIGSEQHRNAGSKRYELTDHLGNVRVTISDLLIARPTGFGDTTQDAEVIDRRDYYPFGMEMPGRRWRATGEDAARFGFNGKENDNEVKGEGNQQDYGFRIYDPRIARFLSVDPLAKEYASNSPYTFCDNSPLVIADDDGRDGHVVVKGYNITVTVKIVLFGEGATRDIAARMRDELNRGWNNDGNGWVVRNEADGTQYNIKFVADVVVRPENSAVAIRTEQEVENRARTLATKEGGDNEILLVSGTDFRSYVKGGQTGVWNVVNFLGSTYRHEFGHLLGLSDRYTDISTPDGTSSIPHSGWEGNIMASLLGRVEQRNIQELFNKYLSGKIQQQHKPKLRAVEEEVERKQGANEGAEKTARNKKETVVTEFDFNSKP